MARPHALNQLVAPGDIAEAVCFSLVRSAKRGASKLYRSGRTFGVFFADMLQRREKASPPPVSSTPARESRRERSSLSSQVKSKVKSRLKDG